MPAGDTNREALLEYAHLLSSREADNTAQALSALATEMVAEIGNRATLEHVHLLVVQTRKAAGQTASVIAEWSKAMTSGVGPKLQNIPLHFFSSDVVRTLHSGKACFTSFDENENACSKTVSGLLRELHLTSYELIPVFFHSKLTALVGVAHNGEVDFLDNHSRKLIQLIGSILTRSIRIGRRERIRRRRHRQWKRVANGACDFALRINAQFEISDVIAFRQAKPPHVTGLLLSEFVARSSCNSVLESVHTAIRLSEPRLLQFFAIDSNGRPCSYAARIEPSHLERQRHELTLYLTNNDVERAYSEELARLREQLDRATRLSLLGNIATEFAHQLTQPLQAISNHVYTLTSRIRTKQSQKKTLSCVANIEASVVHAGAIIKNLRDFITNRKMALAPAKLAKMVSHAVSMVEVQSDRLGGKIHILDSDGLLVPQISPDVYVDEVQTTHVLINLLVNALEACSEAKLRSPRITISAKHGDTPGSVVVEVSDNGPGIQLADPDGIFDRFFTTKVEGFGIGLAICRDVIERQHGTIHARNNADCGCSLHFTLPVYCGQEAAIEKEDIESTSGDIVAKTKRKET